MLSLNLLKDEFLDVPVRHIENVLNEKRTLFESYQTIDTQLRNYSRMSSPFSKVSRPRHRRGHEDTLASAGNDIPKELHAAKQKTEREATHRMKEREAQRAEEANLERAIKNGEMSEWYVSSHLLDPESLLYISISWRNIFETQEPTWRLPLS